MKLHEEFVVAEPVGTVWKFFEQPESVAGCVPGVEYVNILDGDNVQVRATQSVGPRGCFVLRCWALGLRHSSLM